MSKSHIKKIAIAFSSLMAVLTMCQGASAQLNVGRYGVQPGLELMYLQYQLSGQDLSEMQSISGCTVGFGLGCNKFATVLEQLLESKNRASYYDLLMRAAGGEENFRNFAIFYGNNPNLLFVPYASFWQNDSPYILDGYRYLLGSPVSRIPAPGLGLVTNNFYWAPLKVADNSLSPRNGLLNLKYSYGRLLFEEVARIPNFQQEIQAVHLPQNIKQFYLRYLSQGLRALNTKDEALLQNSILNVLSLPFSGDSKEFGRSNIGIPQEFNELMGSGLPADVLVRVLPIFPTPEVISQDISSSFAGDVFVQESSSNKFPGWFFGGVSFAALVLLLALGNNSSSNGGLNTVVTVTPPVSSGSIEQGLTPGGKNIPSNNNQIIEVSPTPPVTLGPGEEVNKVPEPSVVKSLLLLMVLLYLLGTTSKKQHKSYSQAIQ